jgi:hypothetical protein
MLHTTLRLALSGLIAFVFYGAWAYYANSLITDDQSVLLKAALVQGSYSGGVTLIFTFVLELFYTLFKNKQLCLPFVIPAISKAFISNKECTTALTFKYSIKEFENASFGTYIPGVVLSPLPAILLQSIFVIAVNIAFKTPNLWLTVAPSILFSAIYGYIYSFSLAKKYKRK